MTLYRLHTPLNTKRGYLPPGSVSTLKMLTPEALRILSEQGNISEAQTPPLEVLPGYEHMAARLAAYDIITAADFIDMIEDHPADLLRILDTSEKALRDIRRDLETNWLSIPPPSG